MTRWENPESGRYYEVRLLRDLFGGWEVVRTWGRIGSAQGAQRVDPLGDQPPGPQVLEKIAKRRQAHGYVLRVQR